MAPYYFAVISSNIVVAALLYFVFGKRMFSYRSIVVITIVSVLTGLLFPTLVGYFNIYVILLFGLLAVGISSYYLVSSDPPSTSESLEDSIEEESVAPDVENAAVAAAENVVQVEDIVVYTDEIAASAESEFEYLCNAEQEPVMEVSVVVPAEKTEPKKKKSKKKRKNKKKHHKDINQVLTEKDQPQMAAETEIDTEAVEAPEVEVSEVEAPEVEVPEAEVPDIEVPDIEVPDVEMPEVEVPEVEVPEIEVPDVEVPDVEVPDVEESEAEVPEAEVPDIEVPDIEVPDIEIPEVEVPDVEVPDIEVPEAELPEIEASEAEESEAEVPEAEVSEVEVPEVEAPEVEIQEEASEVEESEAEVPEIEVPELGAYIMEEQVEDSSVNIQTQFAESREDLRESYIMRGFDAKEAGDYQLAVKYFESAIELNPSADLAEMIQFDIYTMLRELGLYSKAKESLIHFIDQYGSELSASSMQEIRSQIKYIEILQEMLDKANTPNLPYSRIPALIKMSAEEKFSEWKSESLY